MIDFTPCLVNIMRPFMLPRKMATTCYVSNKGRFFSWVATHHTEMSFKSGSGACTRLELWEINIFSRGQKVPNLEIRQIWDFQPRYTSSNMYFLYRGAKVTIVFLGIVNLASFETFIIFWLALEPTLEDACCVIAPQTYWGDVRLLWS